MPPRRLPLRRSNRRLHLVTALLYADILEAEPTDAEAKAGLRKALAAKRKAKRRQ